MQSHKTNLLRFRKLRIAWSISDEQRPTRKCRGCNRAGLSRKPIVVASLLLFVAIGISYGVRRQFEQMRSDSCEHNLIQLGLALRNYHDLHGSFRPAYLCDKMGKP